jgi:rhodanese-related sulfurtransferase
MRADARRQFRKSFPWLFLWSRAPRPNVHRMRDGPSDPSSFARAASGLGADRLLIVGRELVGEGSNVSDGDVVVVRCGADPADQQPSPFAVACVDSCLAGAPHEVQRAALHQAVQHLERRGTVLLSDAMEPEFVELCGELGLVRESHPSDVGVVRYRRLDRTTVHDLMWTARALIRRVAAVELARELDGPTPPLVVDTRTHTDRCRFGVIAGAIHVPRTVLEWHLDPANGYRHPAVSSLDQPLVLVCNGGYSSSLAAASLTQIGFGDARDLVGGMRAWILHGFAVQPPDHAHVDL